MTANQKTCPVAISKRSPGFSLVELMVAISVLLVTVLIFSQAVGGISSAWRGAEDRMNNHNKARALLGRLRTDIDSMVLRKDLAAFPREPRRFGFFTLLRGVEDSEPNPRALSFVDYSFDGGNPGRLLRKDVTYNLENGVPFATAPVATHTPDPSATPDRGTPPTESELQDVALADGVVAFEWAFLRDDGSFSPELDYVEGGKARSAKGLVVAMLVMDDLAAQRLDDYRSFASFQSEFEVEPPQAGQTDWDPEKEWAEKLGLKPGSSASVAKSYPAQFIRGIRSFKRVFMFPAEN